MLQLASWLKTVDSTCTLESDHIITEMEKGEERLEFKVSLIDVYQELTEMALLLLVVQ